MNFRKFIVPCSIILGCFACCFAIDCSINPSPNDYLGRLQIEVICNHSMYDLRPVKINTTITTVDIQFQPVYVTIVEDKGIVKVVGNLRMAWQDEYCRWKPSDYGSIQMIKVDHYDIWHPKLTTAYYYGRGWYDFLDEIDQYSVRETTVNSNGYVNSRSVVTLNGPCTFDLFDWPDDEWSCELTLGKRNDEDGLVTVHFVNESALDLSTLQEDKNWVIKTISDPAVKDVNTQSEYIELKVTMKRQRSTIVKIYLIPALVALAITIIPFWLTNKISLRLAIHFLATFLNVILLQFVFTFVTKNQGLRPVGLYDLHLNGLYFNLVGIIATAIHAKLMTNTEDPPRFIVNFLSMLASIPYFGACCAIILNDGTEKSGLLDSDDDDPLISSRGKPNQKWSAFLNFMDKSVFFLMLLYVVIKSML